MRDADFCLKLRHPSSGLLQDLDDLKDMEKSLNFEKLLKNLEKLWSFEEMT